MNDSSWMLARLKSETHGHHSAADEARLALVTSTPTLAGYRALLSKIYGFEAAIASAMINSGDDPLIDVRCRKKMELLAADLFALGIDDPTRLSRCRAIPPLRSAPSTLGWMYVVERSNLLNGLLRRHLEKRLPDIERAGSYLSYYEGGAGVRWWELGIALDQVADTLDIADRIVESAHAAFRCQRHWFREQPEQSARYA